MGYVGKSKEAHVMSIISIFKRLISGASSGSVEQAQSLRKQLGYDLPSASSGSAGQPTVRRAPVPIPNSYVVFDLETTGLNSDIHQIIEIGAIRINAGSTKADTLGALIKIDGNVPAKITEITGISKEMLDREGEPIETMLPQLLTFFGDLPLVAFNAKFDIGFLHAAAKAQGLKVKNKHSCALVMARRAWPGRKSYKLSELAKSAGLATQNHRALGDCELALQIYMAAAIQLRNV